MIVDFGHFNRNIVSILLGNHALVVLQQAFLESIRKAFLNIHVEFAAKLPQLAGSTRSWLLEDFLDRNLFCHELRNVFDDIQIRTQCRPGEEIDFLLFKIIFGDAGSMWGCIILLEDTWPVFITIDGRNALGEIFPQQREIFCGIHFLVTDH